MPPIAAMLSSSDTTEKVAFRALTQDAWLRHFFGPNDSTPSDAHLLRTFRLFSPNMLETAFRCWVGGILGALRGALAVDGKAVRRSATGDATASHRVDAFATELGVFLGQEKVAAKINEIDAIRELAGTFHLKPALVGIGLMSCQKRVVAQIAAKGGVFLLLLKGKQPPLFSSITTAFISRSHEEKWPGRINGHLASVLPARGPVDSADLRGCKAVGRIDSPRVVAGQVFELGWRHGISRDLSATELPRAAPRSRAIEDRLHWILDVRAAIFGDFGKTLRKDSAPQNIWLLNTIVLNIIRTTRTRKSKSVPPPQQRRFGQ